MTLIIIVAVTVIALWAIRLVSAGRRYDESTRRAELLDKAAREFPNLKPAQAVDRLFVQTLGEIITKRKRGEETSDLDEDFLILQNERTRLLKEELESEAQFTVRRYPQINFPKP